MTPATPIFFAFVADGKHVIELHVAFVSQQWSSLKNLSAACLQSAVLQNRPHGNRVPCPDGQVSLWLLGNSPHS
jgi:hypothetical protein